MIWLELVFGGFRLKRKDLRWVLVLFFSYGLFNFLSVKVFFGFAVYPGFTWNNVTSVIYVLVTYIIIVTGHKLAVLLSKSISKKIK